MKVAIALFPRSTSLDHLAKASAATLELALEFYEHRN
jgi:hypothetical protein